jgi:UDP-glucose 4-epimerase
MRNVMNILVTGGAGYVGSIVTEELIKLGHDVIVFDNLSTGHRKAVSPRAELVIGDIRNSKDLDQTFSKYEIDAVMHMAADTVVECSMIDPKRFFHNNVIGGIDLLDAMIKYGILKIIFSSSAAIYGNPQSIPIEEDHPKNPVNAYGDSKLMFEHILWWYGQAYGLTHISLRYFNAAGASERLGADQHPANLLIPSVLKAALNKDHPVSIFGDDYPTKDGTCIRDYVHVLDIARAHISALNKLDKLIGKAYNLGSSSGYSVLDIIDVARKVTKADIHIDICPRRAGDPVSIVASSKLAKAELGWKPELSNIEDIISSAWLWTKKHPIGYED